MLNKTEHLGTQFKSCWHFVNSYFGMAPDEPLERFFEVLEPSAGDCFMVYRNGAAYHCGIVTESGYLHQENSKDGVIYQRSLNGKVRYFRPA